MGTIIRAIAARLTRDLAADLSSPVGMPTEALLRKMGEGREPARTRADRPSSWVVVGPAETWGYADTIVR